MIEFVFDEKYDQARLEELVTSKMIERASDIKYAVDNPHGEFKVQMGDEVFGVQWQYVGLEAEDYEEHEVDGQLEWLPVGNWYWEYGSPDFEISCSWKIK